MCPDYTRSYDNAESCKQDICIDSKQIVTIEGICKDCDIGSIPDASNRNCIATIKARSKTSLELYPLTYDETPF